MDPERWTARPSQDGLRVFLGVEGLQVYHVIHVRLNGVRSQSGAELWTPEFWYTLNSLSMEPFRS